MEIITTFLLLRQARIWAGDPNGALTGVRADLATADLADAADMEGAADLAAVAGTAAVAECNTSSFRNSSWKNTQTVFYPRTNYQVIRLPVGKGTTSPLQKK